MPLARGDDNDDEDYLVIDEQLRKHEDKAKRINTYRNNKTVNNQSFALNIITSFLCDLACVKNVRNK